MAYMKMKAYGELSVKEKVAERGAASLSDVELLQAMIGAGASKDDAKQAAKQIHGLILKNSVEGVTLDDLKTIRGIGEAKAALIFAALEFWRRKCTTLPAPIIDSPEAAANQMEYISNKKQEHFVVMTLDGARRLIKTRTVFIGTLMSSLVHPREIFAPAIEDRAASIIIGHNHPSGSLEKSTADIEATRVIRQAGDLLGIHLDDHIIVTSDGGYTSVM